MPLVQDGHTLHEGSGWNNDDTVCAHAFLSHSHPSPAVPPQRITAQQRRRSTFLEVDLTVCENVFKGRVQARAFHNSRRSLGQSERRTALARQAR